MNRFVSYLCMFADCFYSFTFDMAVECVVECGSTFFRKYLRLIWSTAMEIYVCSALLHLKQFRQHSFQSAKENETEKNGEQRAENGNLKQKLKTKYGSQIHLCCCAATDDIRSRSRSRVGREMNDDLYVFYLGCFQLAYGREEKEREQRNCRHEGNAKVDEEVWGRIEGKLLSAFCLLSL